MEDFKLYLIFVAGFAASRALDKLHSFLKKKRIAKDCIKQFKEVLQNIKSGNSVFVSRLNQTVMLDTRLKDYAVVNIVYLMDKETVCIFKENKCIYTTDGVSKSLKEEIVSEISTSYRQQIEDVVEVLGVTISREELETQMRNFEDTIKSNHINPTHERGDIERIMEENEERMDVDAILDKISMKGMKSLTKKEIDFLKQQSSK